MNASLIIIIGKMNGFYLFQDNEHRNRRLICSLSYYPSILFINAHLTKKEVLDTKHNHACFIINLIIILD